jgi:hypothetical protein
LVLLLLQYSTDQGVDRAYILFIFVADVMIDL